MASRENATVSYTIREDLSGLDVHVAGVGDIAFDLNKVSEAVKTKACLFGFAQVRLVDAAAIPRDKETGRSATPQEKYDAIKALVDHYHTGTEEWSRKSAGGGVKQDDGLIITAMCNVLTGGDVDKANLLVSKWGETHGLDRRASLKAWADTEKVAEEMGRIRAQRAKGDADAMVAEMMKG